MPDSSETGGGKCDWQGQGSHITRVSLLALVPQLRAFATNHHESCGLVPPKR